MLEMRASLTNGREILRWVLDVAPTDGVQALQRRKAQSVYYARTDQMLEEVGFEWNVDVEC